MPAWVQLDAVRMRHGQPRAELQMTFPHTLQERKGPFACPRCTLRVITWVPEDDGGTYLRHLGAKVDPECTWLDEATDEQVEALK